MSIFGRQSIKSRVMKHVSQKLAAMDKEHDEECLRIDEAAEKEKDRHADSMVDSITSKFL